MRNLPSSKDLLYFYELANELHVSRTAKKLNISQPSLTISVKRLESLLNAALFVRHAHGVTLTHVGKKLHADTKHLLLSWENTISGINDINQFENAKIVIGCHSTLMPFLRKIAATLLLQHPKLEIHFHHDTSDRIAEAVLKGNIDIGLVTDPQIHQDIVLQPFTQTEFHFWVSIDHQEKIDLYAENTVILCHPQLPPTQYLIKKLQKKIKHPLRFSTVNHLEALVAMTIEGYGIGILPSAYTQTFFSDKLKIVPNTPIFKKPLYLSYRSENKNAIQVILKAIKKLV